MIEIGRRVRPMPAPAAVVRASLLDPWMPGAREWLLLRADERRPTIVARGRCVVWTSLWPHRPDVRIELRSEDDGAGSTLEWLLLATTAYDDSAVGHLRKRMNELLYRDLRLSYGQ